MSVDNRERLGAIDIGTNSVLLVIAASSSLGVTPVLERATITRLGEGVDHTRQLSAAASSRTLACLREYAEDLRAHGVTRLAVVGTSALRDAQGGESFLAEAERILGVRPLVIAGVEEAQLTFRGALSGLAVSGALLVFDVGGGSTELILGDARQAQPSARVSLDIGSVRLFERHVHSDPPALPELSALEVDIERELQKASTLLSQAAAAGLGAVTLVGVAGTVTTLKALHLGLPTYDAARVHGSRLSLAEVERLCELLSSLPLTERKGLPGLEPKRADVIVAGALIVRQLMQRARATDLVVSDRGVRFGLLERLCAG